MLLYRSPGTQGETNINAVHDARDKRDKQHSVHSPKNQVQLVAQSLDKELKQNKADNVQLPVNQQQPHPQNADNQPKQDTVSDAQKVDSPKQSQLQSSDNDHKQEAVLQVQTPNEQQLQPQSQLDATLVRLVSLPCDDTNEFVPFVRRSVGCASRKSCCFESSHCKDCPALGHPCKLVDAVKPVNDAGVFNAMILRHPVRRVMSCFINIGIKMVSGDVD